MGAIMTADPLPLDDPRSSDEAPVLVVGCGRSHRRDDQIGLRVAELLSADPPEHARVLASEAPGTDILTEIADARLLVVVDAAAPEDCVAPGEWTRLALARANLPRSESLFAELRTSGASSTHALSVADALKVGERLGVLPPEVWVYAVAGGDFGYGDDLSERVRRSIEDVAARIRRDVREWSRRTEEAHA